MHASTYKYLLLVHMPHNSNMYNKADGTNHKLTRWLTKHFCSCTQQYNKLVPLTSNYRFQMQNKIFKVFTVTTCMKLERKPSSSNFYLL